MENNKQVTAVEWLVEQLEQHHTKIDIKNTVVFQQAKEMEKQQHQQTAIYFYPSALKRINFEQYYKETYGK
jgi:hypothetical protein